MSTDKTVMLATDLTGEQRAKFCREQLLRAVGNLLECGMSPAEISIAMGRLIVDAVCKISADPSKRVEMLEHQVKAMHSALGFACL